MLMARAQGAIGEPVEVKFRLPKNHLNTDRFMAVIEKLYTSTQHGSGLVEERVPLAIDPVASFYEALEDLVGPVMVYNIRRDLAQRATAQGKETLADELMKGMKDRTFAGGLMIASAVQLDKTVGHPNLQRAVNMAEAVKRGEIDLGGDE